MNPAQVVKRGRRVAKRVMTDRVDILRPTGGWTEDGDGNQVPATSTVNSAVKAWIRPIAQNSRIVESGGQPVTLLAYDVLLPHDVSGIEIDDLVVVTSSDGTDLQGRTLTVVDVTWGTHQVARRLVCRAQTGG